MMINFHTTASKRRCAACAVVIGVFVGCSGSDLASVAGTALKNGGDPLVGARVIAREKTTGASATGGTDAGGRFELKSNATEAGVPPGEYEVIVVEERGPIGSQQPPSISLRYRSVSTSGLAFSVAPGEDKDVNWTLDPP